MLLLALFAVVAGAATAVSPCVLPVLPVALGAGLTGGRRRPLGIVTGLALSFTFATVALVYVISALGLPGGLLRTVAIVVLALFGVLLLVPPLSARLEAPLSRLTGRARLPGATGFWSGLLLGAGLGLVYAPCAGPILAGVITVSAMQSFTADRLIVALSYGAGSAIVLYALMLGGRRLTAPLARRSGRFQAAMGAVMLVVALLMLGNYDTRFETALAAHVPAALVNPDRSLETSSPATIALAHLRGIRPATTDHSTARLARGGALPVLGDAPDITGGERWFNTPGGRRLDLRELRGRVVLVDFWTYSCINCLRTLPYLRAWDAKYRADGLTIVGVHTPEFPFERSASNVAEAIHQTGIRYPVVQDNAYAIWIAYQNQYWPAEYLIDGRGRVRAVDFGEGDYGARERAIRSLLAERGTRRLGSMTDVHAQQPSRQQVTPESYLGAERAERFANGALRTGTQDFGVAAPHSPLPLSHLRYTGTWRIGPQTAVAGRGARLDLEFRARRVFLVLGSPARARDVRVLLDGHPLPARLSGADVHGGVAHVRFQRLYRLVNLPGVEQHRLTVLPARGVAGYAFTFG